ncbi:alpha/beta hydrolase [Tropicimonas sp. IMCC34011]|uniref:alpha/beta hydrolase n=1 Tax=Tropicimonas sp. IMCC34011 TaxID=2248759 RepID=UPI000E285E19|nr:alpha/beta fold hydrolase [Tropicimonas sp. IMCC34011]
MMRELNAKRAGAPKGTAKQIVIFVHGYGADGADLLGLAGPLAPHLPDTAFYAPDAPDPSSANPAGFQWFPIPWIDGSSEEEAAEGLVASAEDLDAFITRVLNDEGLEADRLALVGFSQGTMMSLHVAPRREDQIAGIAGFSGRLVAPERLPTEALSFPPILLLHGDRDDVVPYPSMDEAERDLTAAGFSVATYTMEGTPHGIAPDGLGQALAFLKDVFGID